MVITETRVASARPAWVLVRAWSNKETFNRIKKSVRADHCLQLI